jgi:hypothetical protein
MIVIAQSPAPRKYSRDLAWLAGTTESRQIMKGHGSSWIMNPGKHPGGR